ncbi:DUF4340 domain-containing protein [Tautonia plasticadhaerens]|uniref:DUF4340 domain-containing protein n=1 Tax=Tautonia plasticadhaerens TaxID=2527974 RepID=A0A518H2Q1_9BACT|nr:DUF4340 domain-containing protein [Tautonia plasticadhaerens]QDV35093.1 hypothetical protein ElP_29950 [Tautonia plasticadhaerens]
MNETAKTIAFAGVALVLMAAASLATWLPDWRGPGAGFDDQGEPFFPAFAETIDADPLAARVLEVVSYDEDTAEVRPFQVEFKDGEWTIPSHHDYPADAQDRMARLAAQVSELTKDAIRSDLPSDHEELGVIDPMDQETTSLQGRGTKITLRAADGGEPLAELILGNDVPDREGLRYVRIPGKNRVYSAEVDLDLTTRFSDWIDTDLLDVTTPDATKLSYDTRKVNPDERTADGAFLVQPGDPIVLAKSGSEENPNDWTMDDLGPEEEVDTTKVNDVIRAVDNLKVVGVRPLPTARNAVLRSLVSKGFYPTQQGDLLSNEGSVAVSTDEGIVYTLRFGEITLAAGDELTAGVGEDRDESAEGEAEGEAEPKGESAEQEDDAEADQTEGRYLIVSVSFDPALIPEEDEGSDAPEMPDDVFARAPDDPARVEAEAKLAEEAKRKDEERQRKITEGEEKVAELNRQFANWYYVVPGDDFRKVALGRDAFIKAAGEPDSEPASASPAGPGGFDPHGGLPPGLNLPGLGGPQG